MWRAEGNFVGRRAVLAGPTNSARVKLFRGGLLVWRAVLVTRTPSVTLGRPVEQMPKPIYGKGRKSKGKSSAGQSSEDAGHGWLTLITTLPEEQMHAAILVALKEGGQPPP